MEIVIFLIVIGAIVYFFINMAGKSSKSKNSDISYEITVSLDYGNNKSNFTPKSKPNFLGKGDYLEIGSYIIADPMVYVLKDKAWDGFDASLICTKRSLIEPKEHELHGLSYWPTTFGLNKSQYSYYIQWLANGKKDPNIDLGYVFLYFYGLERRALIDGCDIQEIVNEILRLLNIYDHNRSFVNYSTSLLLYLAQANKYSPDINFYNTLFIKRKGRLSDELKYSMLAYLAHNNTPLPDSWALEFAKQDERSKNSVVAKRAASELLKLFSKRYTQEIKDKAIPKLGKSRKTIEYYAASPSLMRGYGYSNNIPDTYCTSVVGWKRQLASIIQIYDLCIDDLKAYSRNLAGDIPEASIVYESLPLELREEADHPKQDEWDQLLFQYANDEGCCFVPVGKIAEMRSINYREKLTITQSKSIASFIESLGNAVEPDPRYTNKALGWNEEVAIIRLPDDPVIPTTHNYALASLIVPLSLEISLADGTHDQEERQVILRFLKDRFMLNQNESIRLEALLDYYLRNEITLTGLKTKLIKSLNEDQRKNVGKFLVMIAGAVDGICREEIKALEKTFNSLGLEKSEVSCLIGKFGFADISQPSLKIHGKTDEGEKIPPKQTVLDLERIRQIHSESIEASKILLEAMEKYTEDDDVNTSEDKVIPISTLNTQLSFSTELHPFFTDLTKKEIWSLEDINNLAKTHKTTVSAAVEEINCWADESLGDFIIEEGNPFRINKELLSQIGRSA